MGYDYALVHLKYNLPPAIVLSLIYRPLLTRLDIYRILFLTTIAVVYTTPWDSYLIRTRIWTYPEHVIIGPKLFAIPLEEVFFFVIQTYNTSLIYLILSKTTFQPTRLRHEEKSDKWRYYKLFGQLIIAFAFKQGLSFVSTGAGATYMGMILVWALPVFALLWSLAYQFIIGLPWINTILPIVLPTLYLWIVDTLALRRGTWTIESGTKLGIRLWPYLEIEEAIFFLFTNTLIVWGLVAFDNAIAILDAFPVHFPKRPALPSPALLVRALLLPAAAYDQDRIHGLKDADDRLSKKSRSFYLASGVFEGRLRIDLVLLYSFCRVADDLIDNAASSEEAKQWLQKLKKFLDLSYDDKDPAARDPNVGSIARFVVHNFPRDAHSALLQLQTRRLSPQPLRDLLRGFETDLRFRQSGTGKDAESWPIKTEADLDAYSHYVAGTVAHMCIEHCLYNSSKILTKSEQSRLVAAGDNMGVALQCINIARDFEVDALMNRVYLPTAWLKKEKLTPADFIKSAKHSVTTKDDTFFAEKVDRLRTRLLDKAFNLYAEARPAIEQLPHEVRAPMRVAVESYVEIGRTLRRKGYVVKKGRATVPVWRRLYVAWNALSH